MEKNHGYPVDFPLNQAIETHWTLEAPDFATSGWRNFRIYPLVN